MRLIRQKAFARAPFDSRRLNIHTSSNGKRDVLVVMVHGLNGEGYDTWLGLPEQLFSDGDEPGYDIGIFDYPSGLRRFKEKKSTVDSRISQLAEHLRELDDEYSHIFLLGHSLGGILIEAAVKKHLDHRAHQKGGGTGSLSGLFMAASPRAGTGWARLLPPIIFPEAYILRTLNRRSSEVQQFFTNHIEKLNAVRLDGKKVLPVYAIVAGGDYFVREFSAVLGVPETQQLNLYGDHSSIIKPGVEDRALADWLKQKIRERIQVKEQAAREKAHAGSVRELPPQRAFVTKLVTDVAGLDWIKVYNEACDAVTATDVAIQDRSGSNDVRSDLLIAVHDAELVLADDPTVRARVERARDEKVNVDTASVGICPVGQRYTLAEHRVNQWLADPVVPDGIYICGAPDAEGLRERLEELLSLMIGRKFRWNRMLQSWSDDDSSNGFSAWGRGSL